MRISFQHRASSGGKGTLLPTHRQMSRPKRRISVVVGASCLATFLAIGLQSSWAGATPPSSWSLTSTPNKTSSDSLNAVSCTSVNFCMAVGSYMKSSNIDRNLIEEWEGSTWTIVRSPDEGTGDNSLDGVSCTSERHCVAVGYGTGAQYEEGIILTFNGHHWSITSILSSVHGIYAFSAVSCPSRNFCVAVGHAAKDAGTQSVIYTWNGSHWNLSNASTLSLTLTGVSCPTSHFCAAVGNEPGNQHHEYPAGVILVFNGVQWSRSAVIDTVHGAYTLSGVSCTGIQFCEAVGYLGDDAGFFTVIDTWNGTNWMEPATGTIHNATLASVSCTNKSDCVAAGYGGLTSGHPKNLIESWDGTWSKTPTPDQGTGTNQLNGVSCFKAPDCAAVGYFDNGSNPQTLAIVSFATDATNVTFRRAAA